MILNLNFRLCLCAMLVILPALFPVWADDFDHELKEARDIFLKGVDGDKHAVRSAFTRFRSLSQHHSADPVYLAYLGASITLQGRDAQNGVNKQRYTEEGLGKIDQALKMLSDNDEIPSSRRLDTMLVAANSFIYIPAFFNRYDRGKRLLGEILEHKDFNGMAAGFKAAAYFAAAMVARGETDEDSYHRYLKLIIDTDPEGRDGRAASVLLNE